MCSGLGVYELREAQDVRNKTVRHLQLGGWDYEEFIYDLKGIRNLAGAVGSNQVKKCEMVVV